MSLEVFTELANELIDEKNYEIKLEIIQYMNIQSDQIENIEHRILFNLKKNGVFHDDFSMWLEIPETSCKLLRLIRNEFGKCISKPEISYQTIYTIFDDVSKEIILEKLDYLIYKYPNLDNATFINIISFVPKHKWEFLFNWYHDITLGFDLLINDMYDAYLIFFEISEFDPFPSIFKRTKFKFSTMEANKDNVLKKLDNNEHLNLEEIDTAIDFELNLSQIMNLIRTIKDQAWSITHNLILNGRINKYWNELIDIIDIYINIRRTYDNGSLINETIMNTIKYGNTKLIDRIMTLYPELINRIHKKIICYGDIYFINYYFPDFSKETIYEVWEKN